MEDRRGTKTEARPVAVKIQVFADSKLGDKVDQLRTYYGLTFAFHVWSHPTSCLALSQ